MKCDKCGDNKVHVAQGKGLELICLNCAFNAPETKDDWRKASRWYSSFIADPAPCDDSARERPKCVEFDGGDFTTGTIYSREPVDWNAALRALRKGE